jgi:hypothetical protein
MKSLKLAVLVIAAVAGCKKKEANDTSAKPAESGKSEPATKPPEPANDGPFAAWDMPARKAAWQGAWAGEGGSAGSKAAWQVDGDKVTMVDSRGEKTLELQIESPCTAKFVERSASGSSSTTNTYTLQNGVLITGLGNAGSRKGDQAIVCGSGKIYSLDAKGCTEWEDNFGKLQSKPAECGFRKDGDKEVFFYKGMGGETTLLVEGDVIWSEQLKAMHAAKHPDLAAAKKAQAL